MIDDENKKNWWDRLTNAEQCFLLTTDLSTSDLINDPDAHWDVKARDIADEVREVVVDMQIPFAKKALLLDLMDKITRLDGRPGTDALREWQRGAQAAAVIAHRPKEGGHTEEFYLTHLDRYTRSAQENTPYAAGADCVAAAILASKRKEESV